MIEKELRSFQSASFRADDDSAEMRVSGYASVFNEETEIGGLFREVVRPGAFSGAIGSDDVVFLVDHEGLPLARSTAGAGTLSLREDSKGLLVETILNENDPDATRLYAKMQRGDINKMSFAFIATDERWTEKEGELPLREIMSARLFDVSAVTRPAYDGTSIAARSLENYRNSQVKYVSDATKARLRMKLALASERA